MRFIIFYDFNKEVTLRWKYAFENADGVYISSWNYNFLGAQKKTYTATENLEKITQTILNNIPTAKVIYDMSIPPSKETNPELFI